MDLLTLGPDDDRLAHHTHVVNAVRSVDAPWVHRRTRDGAVRQYRHGWDGEPDVPLLAVVDGEPVAAAAYGISERDNRHLAWVQVDVHPAHRRRGHGTAVADAVERMLLDLGRTTIGVSCWEAAETEGFALARGYERAQVGVNRRQHLADVDAGVVDTLHARAVEASGDYELVRLRGRTPDADLDRLADLTAAINDAPTDGLDVEDEVFDADRMRAYEDAQLGRRFDLHRLVARHRGTGEWAGQTVVVVEEERPTLGEQHDTSVVAAHRGHRLGLLLKTGMLQWLRETTPDLAEIDTWNAESNDHMIGVNEALGYRVMGRQFNLQRSWERRAPLA